MKNLGLYKENLSVPRKQDLDKLEERVNAAEDQLIVLDSDITSIEGDMATKLTTPTGTQGQFLGFTANNVVGAVTLPAMGGLYTDKFDGTLGTSWTSSGSKVYQQITIAGMTADQCPIVFPNWGTNRAAEEAAWNSIESGVESFAGYVRFYAPKATTTPVKFSLMYKK